MNKNQLHLNLELVASTLHLSGALVECTYIFSHKQSQIVASYVNNQQQTVHTVMTIIERHTNDARNICCRIAIGRFI